MGMVLTARMVTPEQLAEATASPELLEAPLYDGTTPRQFYRDAAGRGVAVLLAIQ